MSGKRKRPGEYSADKCPGMVNAQTDGRTGFDQLAQLS